MKRFWDKVQITDDCWLWQGSRNDKGYGHIRVDRRLHGAHRVAYELVVGPIPDGLVIDHLCRVRNCVRPDHLETVTNAENLRRGLSGILKVECVNGHAYTPENTYRYPDGRRACRTCRADLRHQAKQVVA
jgi:hypothetical protein